MIVLLGYAAYIAASVVLGCRLIWLWRRTGEWPELSIGLAFLMGGACGFCAWLGVGLLASRGASPEAIKSMAMIGLLVTVIGALNTGAGMALIYRPGVFGAKVWVATVGAAMVLGLWRYAAIDAASESIALWWTLGLSSLIYAWGAFEALSLGRILGRRARLGLADPLVVGRAMHWGYSSASVVLSIWVGFAGRLLYGPLPEPWVSTVASSLLMIGAASIWLGFFPPSWYRDRLARSLEAVGELTGDRVDSAAATLGRFGA